MKNILIIMISLLSLQGFSQKSSLQTVNETVVNSKLMPSEDIEFLSFLKKSVDFYKSDAFLKNKKLKTEFNTKVGETYTKIECTTEDFKNWISANLTETNFNSVDEAVLMFNEMNKARKEINIEESNILDQESTFNEKYGENIMSLYRAFIAAIII